MNVISKIVMALAATSLTWLALRKMADREEEAQLELEVARELAALREHLFSR